MKITPADQWFGRCVKERVSWTCERCGKRYGAYPAQGLDCSHYVSRTNRAVRWEPLNAWAHCRGCHQYLGGNPHIFTAWAKDRLGADLYDLLIEKSNDISLGKEARRNQKEIAEYFKAEYERMLQLRAEGVTGRIEFIGWL